MVIAIVLPYGTFHVLVTRFFIVALCTDSPDRAAFGALQAFHALPVQATGGLPNGLVFILYGGGKAS